MRESPKEIALKWLKQAEYDLKDAVKALEWESFNLACFLSQQAAEKALKAFLYFLGFEEIKGHSVGSLCELAGRHDLAFVELVSFAKWLDKFYIPTRYPDALPDLAIPSEVYDREDGERAIGKAKRIVDLVKEKISLG